MNTPNPHPLPDQTGFHLPVGVQRDVERYRANCPGAAQALLDRFAPYLAKWRQLLRAGRWDGKDPEIRQFLSMLGSVDLSGTAQILAHRLKAFEPADLDQELSVVLLETALHARSIRKQFRFRLFRRVVTLLKDPVVYHYHHAVSLVDSGEGDGVWEIAQLDGVEIDPAWVEGLTCGPGFDELSPQERQMLRLHKWLGYTIDQTAEILGVSASTVARGLARSRGILRVVLLER